MHYLTIFCLTLTAYSTALAVEYQPPKDVPLVGIGFRGDRSGYFPKSNPPTTFDNEKNLLWQAPLVNWSWSSPVPVGNRVFMMAEPTWSGALWPQLCCYDADTGERLWVVDVNPLDAFPDMDAATRKAITEDFEWWYGLHNTIHQVTRPHLEKEALTPDDPRLTEINARLAHLDIAIKPIRKKGGPGGHMNCLDRRRSLEAGNAFKDRKQRMFERIRPYGLFSGLVELGVQDRSGLTLSTPVTDGEHVWVMTSHSTLACFGMDGRHVWSHSLVQPDLKPGGYTYLYSPILWQDKVIALAGMEKRAVMVACDRKTGQQRWAIEPSAKHQIAGLGKNSRAGGTLQILTVGETPVLFSGQGGLILPDTGKKFPIGIPYHLGTAAIDDEHDIIYCVGNGDSMTRRWAVQLAAVDGAITTEAVWVRNDNSVSSLTFAAGRLFRERWQLDPATGYEFGNPDGKFRWKDLKKDPIPRTAPHNRHTLLVTQQHVYGLMERKEKGSGARYGICEVFTHEGELVASNRIDVPKLDQAQKARLIEQGFPYRFSYSCSMNISGDRLYIASQDFLFCFGMQ